MGALGLGRLAAAGATDIEGGAPRFHGFACTTFVVTHVDLPTGGSCGAGAGGVDGGPVLAVLSGSCVTLAGDGGDAPRTLR